MSHIGKQPILLPDGVTVEVTRCGPHSACREATQRPAPRRAATLSGGQQFFEITVKGPKGQRTVYCPAAGQQGPLSLRELQAQTREARSAHAERGATRSEAAHAPRPAQSGRHEAADAQRRGATALRLRSPRGGHAHAAQSVGTLRSILNQMIEGVSKGFEASLSIQGVGYRAEVIDTERQDASGQPPLRSLHLYVGFSHVAQADIPTSIEVTCPNPTTIVAKGPSYTELTQFVNKVRLIRPVSKDPYGKKGLAIRRGAVVAQGSVAR